MSEKLIEEASGRLSIWSEKNLNSWQSSLLGKVCSIKHLFSYTGPSELDPKSNLVVHVTCLITHNLF